MATPTDSPPETQPQQLRQLLQEEILTALSGSARWQKAKGGPIPSSAIRAARQRSVRRAALPVRRRDRRARRWESTALEKQTELLANEMKTLSSNAAEKIV